MYGPVATSAFVPYVVGACLSIGPANSCGTGAEIGRLSAPMTTCACGLVRWNTIVVLFGVVIPGTGPPLALDAPSTEAKYVMYGFATLGFQPRSIAYATSFDVTVRLTGGLNLTVGWVWTVM